MSIKIGLAVSQILYLQKSFYMNTLICNILNNVMRVYLSLIFYVKVEFVLGVAVTHNATMLLCF